jgi:6,7-dimethyl-8-ribityllumazine synthase
MHEKKTSSFAIVVSQFNATITGQLLQGTLSRFTELGVTQDDIFTIHVPGAIEIPLIAQQLAKTGRYQAIVCLGAVIRGETSHYDYVCEQVSQGCQRVMLDFELPVIFGILTTNTIEQAEERIGGQEGHKGREAADIAFNMALLMQKISRMNT